MTDEQRSSREVERLAFEAAATELDVKVESWGGSAVFQIVGAVAGRAFYLRCRHGLWTVTIASDDDPLGDPVWPNTIRVAAGDEDDLFDDGSGRPGPVVALLVAVYAVTDFLRRRTCDHVPGRVAGNFCTLCGMRLGPLRVIGVPESSG